jgi:hypothetical protein
MGPAAVRRGREYEVGHYGDAGCWGQVQGGRRSLTLVELIQELTAARDFGVTLCCPDCGGPMSEYRCRKCAEQEKLKRGAPGVASASLGALSVFARIAFGVLLAATLGILGSLLFGGAGGVGAVVGLGAAAAGGSRALTGRPATLLSLAKRYQQ